MSGTTALPSLAVWLTLTRALGQSALSVVSLAIVGQWFVRRIDSAMAIYSLRHERGLHDGVPAGWDGGPGLGLAERLVRRGNGAHRRAGAGRLAGRAQKSRSVWAHARTAMNKDREHATPAVEDLSGYSWNEAIAMPAFWIFAIGAALYGLVASGIGLFNESILAERGFGPDLYYQTLVVTAMTALLGNFLGGWLAGRMPLDRLLAISLAVLTAGLAVLPYVATRWQVMMWAVGDGPWRRPGDGAVLRGLAARLRPPASRPDPGRGPGHHRARVGGRTIAPRLVRRMDRKLLGDVPASGGRDRARRRWRPDRQSATAVHRRSTRRSRSERVTATRLARGQGS